MKKVFIEEIGELIKKRDVRTIRNWCEKHNIILIGKGKSAFAFEVAIKLEIERPFINSLKRKFGSEWESVYKLHVEGNIPALNVLHDIPKVTKKTYKPVDNLVNNYLEKFKNHGNNNEAA